MSGSNTRGVGAGWHTRPRILQLRRDFEDSGVTVMHPSPTTSAPVKARFRRQLDHHERRATATNQPKPVGHLNRTYTSVGGRARIRTWDRGVMSPLL